MEAASKPSLQSPQSLCPKGGNEDPQCGHETHWDLGGYKLVLHPAEGLFSTGQETQGFAGYLWARPYPEQTLQFPTWWLLSSRNVS